VWVPSQIDEDPQTWTDALAFQKRLYSCSSWSRLGSAPDGTESPDDKGRVWAVCGCGLLTGWHNSPAAAERALDAHLDGVGVAARGWMEGWITRHPDAAREPDGLAESNAVSGTAPRWAGPCTRVGQTLSQYGGVEAILSRQSLAGAFSLSIEHLAQRLSLRVEQSFTELHDCAYVYFETDEDCFMLLNWDQAANVTLYAHIANPSERGGDSRAIPELVRFIALAGIEADKLVFPLWSHLNSA
jgi:hypothetical protein